MHVSFNLNGLEQHAFHAHLIFFIFKYIPNFFTTRSSPTFYGRVDFAPPSYTTITFTFNIQFYNADLQLNCKYIDAKMTVY